MEKYKIKRNPKPLSDDQINRHKDFGKLLNDQQKLHRYKDGTKPLYKNPGFLAMMVVVGVVVLMLVVDHPEKEGQEIPKDTVVVAKADTGLQIPIDPQKNTTSDLAIKENIGTPKNITKTQQEVAKVVRYELFKLDPKEGAALYTNAGWRLLIPTLAFSDKVTNEVTLKFRANLSLPEEGIHSDASFTSAMAFELVAYETATGKEVVLSKPILLEYNCPVDHKEAAVYCYEKEKKIWKSEGKEKFVYRFRMNANDDRFPELVNLKDLAWEIPAEGINPTDFNYIFNRSWKSFSYKTTDKKELAVKGTNGSSSFKGITDIASILGDTKKDQQLRTAFYNVYNFASGKSQEASLQKQSLELIEDWKNSKEGIKYQDWLNTESVDFQFYSNVKTSKITLDRLGIHCLDQNIGKLRLGVKRILRFEKYPERTPAYNQETEQN